MSNDIKEVINMKTRLVKCPLCGTKHEIEDKYYEPFIAFICDRCNEMHQTR